MKVVVAVHVTVLPDETREVGRERFTHGRGRAFSEVHDVDVLLGVQSAGNEALNRAYFNLVKPVDPVVPHG